MEPDKTKSPFKNWKSWFLTIWAFLFLGIAIWQTTTRLIKKNQLDNVLSVSEEKISLDIPTKFSNCNVNGPLPDHECTPGSVFPDVTKDEICTPGYTKTVRNVSTSLKKQVYVEYNVKYPQNYGSYEVDHLIPLALGGNNEIANLWPEASSPSPGFKEKDTVEIYLHDEFCAGNISLNIAQNKIANNWILIYQNLDQEKVKELKSKYKSWTN